MTYRTLYHAAPQCVEEAILAEGLKPNIEGLVYLSDTPDGCLTFMGFRLLAHMHGITTAVINGKEVQVPDVVQHDHIAVFAIDVSQLDPDRLREGTDHSPRFFGDAKSLTHDGPILPEHILNVAHYQPEPTGR